MKVLIAHNRYRSDQPSGENIVVDAEIVALREAGVDVVPFIRSSDEIAAMGALDKFDVAMGPIRSRSGVKQFKRLLAEHRPDVVHVHNVFPLLSPWIIREAKAHGIPVVMTVHNFRLDCVAGTYLRDGKVCTDCAGQSIATPALRHGCYRGSRVQSVPMVLGRSVHRRTWQSVDRFFAFSTFHAEFLHSLGIAPERIVIRPTSAPDPGPTQPPGRDVLFVGRLGPEKGVDVLLQAWASSAAREGGRRLHLVGDGELRSLADAAGSRDESIVVHGQVTRESVSNLMRECGPIVVPSTCFEGGLTLVLIEGMAHGRPAIVSDIGGLGRVVSPQDGWVVPPGDAMQLANVLTHLDDLEILKRGREARQVFLSRYSEAHTTPLLVDTYSAMHGQAHA